MDVLSILSSCQDGQLTFIEKMLKEDQGKIDKTMTRTIFAGSVPPVVTGNHFWKEHNLPII